MIGSITDLLPRGVRVSPEDIADVFRRYCDQNEHLYPLDAARQALEAISTVLDEMGYECEGGRTVRLRLTIDPPEEAEAEGMPDICRECGGKCGNTERNVCLSELEP